MDSAARNSFVTEVTRSLGWDEQLASALDYASGSVPADKSKPHSIDVARRVMELGSDREAVIPVASRDQRGTPDSKNRTRAEATDPPAASGVRPELRPASVEPDSQGGQVLRFPDFDLRRSGAAWEGVTPLEKALLMLRLNGRHQYRVYPRPYFDVLTRLEQLWKEHGAKPGFVEERYLPEVKKWVTPLLESTGR